MMNLLSDIIREDEKEFSDLKSIIKRKIGFNCEDYKQPHLKRRLAVRLRATESKSYRDYAQMLSKNEDEVNKLKETLTVNVTELFRNPET
ncbi:MAG TPA: protein-glutamate O-methyltransferase CheR, partial [Candidatus Methanoperedens sp.]